jgi:hypothetical protein
VSFDQVATPTSVVLMAINTVIGFIYRENIQHGVHPAAWVSTHVKAINQNGIVRCLCDQSSHSGGLKLVPARA